MKKTPPSEGAVVLFSGNRNSISGGVKFSKLISDQTPPLSALEDSEKAVFAADISV